MHTFIHVFSKTWIVLQNTLLYLEAKVKWVETAGVLSVSSHSEYKVMHPMPLSAKKALSALIFFRVIGKVSVLDSSKGKEPREIVSDPSSQSVLSPMQDTKEFELLYSSVNFTRQVCFAGWSKVLVEALVSKLSLVGAINRVGD